MTIEKLNEAGYKLRSWSVATIRGERMITLLLSDAHGRKFITGCHCSDKKLMDEDFTIPIKIEKPMEHSYGFEQ